MLSGVSDLTLKREVTVKSGGYTLEDIDLYIRNRKQIRHLIACGLLSALGQVVDPRFHSLSYVI